MLTPSVLAVCTPEDFFNPFPPLVLQAAICAGVLSLLTLLLFFRTRRFFHSETPLWRNRLYHLLRWGALVSAGGVWILAGWLWWQQQHFVTWCLFDRTSFPIRLFVATQLVVKIGIALTILFLLASFVLAGSARKHQANIQPSQ